VQARTIKALELIATLIKLYKTNIRFFFKKLHHGRLVPRRAATWIPQNIMSSPFTLDTTELKSKIHENSAIFLSLLQGRGRTKALKRAKRTTSKGYNKKLRLLLFQLVNGFLPVGWIEEVATCVKTQSRAYLVPAFASFLEDSLAGRVDLRDKRLFITCCEVNGMEEGLIKEAVKLILIVTNHLFKTLFG
jgi:hypothetical protein